MQIRYGERNKKRDQSRTIAQAIRKQFKEDGDSAATLRRIEKEQVGFEFFGVDDVRYIFSDSSTILHRTLVDDFVI